MSSNLYAAGVSMVRRSRGRDPATLSLLAGASSADSAAWSPRMAVRCPGRHTDMRLDAADRQRGRSSAGTSGTHPVPATHGLGRRARCCRVKPPYRIRSPDQHWSVDRALEASFCAAAALLALSAPERTFGVRAIAWHERLRPQRAAWSAPG